MKQWVNRYFCDNLNTSHSTLLRQNVPRYDLLHDLLGPPADGEDPVIPVESFTRYSRM